MKAIRKNATKETIEFNIDEINHELKFVNRGIKDHTRRLKQYNAEAQRLFTKKQELIKLLKTKKS